MKDQVGEIRTLLFPKSVVVTALTREQRRRSKPLPHGIVKEVAMREREDRIHVGVAIETPDRELLRFTFDQHFVAASILRYCFAERIPVPKRADKSLTTLGDQLVMTMRLNVTPAMDIALAMGKPLGIGVTAMDEPDAEATAAEATLEKP